MRRLLLFAALSAALAGGLTETALAAGLRGPSAQQNQCLAKGGSFSAGYDADTYVCVETGAIQTCRFGSNPAACNTEASQFQNRNSGRGVPAGPSRPSAIPRFF